ncbi:MAG: hypothetical protein MJ252_05115 [archaeon]|nr:hypothetical protein [archaeon]
MSNKNKEYLRTKVRCILKPLVYALLKSKPDDPVIFLYLFLGSIYDRMASK